MKTFVTLILGIFLGLASSLSLRFLNQESESEIWKTKNELISNSGIVIPAGTELTLYEYMSEGFIALELSINVQGETLGEFEVSKYPKSNLKIPVWVTGSN